MTDHRDAEIAELKASLEGARFDLKYQMHSKNLAVAYSDKLGIRIGELRAKLRDRDAEIERLKAELAKAASTINGIKSFAECLNEIADSHLEST